MSTSKPSKSLSKFSKKELDHFFAIAKSVKKNQAFTLLKAQGQSTFGRFLIVIPKKYGNAPQRNKLRRQLKSIFLGLKLYEQLSDYAIIVRPTLKNYDFKQLTQILMDV